MVQKILITEKELEGFKNKETKLKTQLAEAKKRLGATAQGSWGGCAAKEQAQQDVRYYTIALADITKTIKKCSLTEKSSDKDTVQVGSRVKLEIDGEVSDYVIGIGQPDDNLPHVSPISPLGKALLGRKTGETISFFTPAGEVNARIVSIGE
ncbi:GreA/GreB family elongation factor [Patescibacteria group bacterium]|nr:GreA/GreB family elongation factor [Patescibacteria group bacterium]